MGELTHICNIKPWTGEPVEVSLIECGEGQFVCLEQDGEAIYLPTAQVKELVKAANACSIVGSLRHESELEVTAEEAMR